MTTRILAFDLETIPDVAGLRVLLPERAHLDDDAFIDSVLQDRREKTGGSDFLPLHLHRVVAVGCAFRDEHGFQVRCLGSLEDTEARLVSDFFRVVERRVPILVSWNGGGFDLPVLHYRAMIHGLRAPRYWDTGDADRDFRYNNYLNRFHQRHTDLMDVLANYQARAAVPLDQLSQLCGFPGKLGMSGDQVWSAYRQGDLAGIRAYCETDVVNTYLLYCRYQKLRGALDDASYDHELSVVHSALELIDAPHWREFLQAWDPLARTAAPVSPESAS